MEKRTNHPIDMLKAKSASDGVNHELYNILSFAKFIDQQVYKFAVNELFAKDLNLIKSLKHEVETKLQPFDGQAPALNLNDIADDIIDTIVLGTDKAFIFETIKPHYQTETGFGLPLPIELLEQINQLFRECHFIPSDESKGFAHEYMPFILTYDFDFRKVLEYTMDLITKGCGKRKVPNEPNGYYFTAKPYITAKKLRYRSTHSINFSAHELPVPDNAISKQENEPVTMPDGLTEDQQGEIFFHLGQEQGYVNITTGIQLTIDLTRPLSNKDVEAIISELQSTISRKQASNRAAEINLATTTEELSVASKIPDINTEDWMTFLNRNTPEVAQLNTLTDCKNQLIGLLCYQTYLARQATAPKEKRSIQLCCEEISEELTTIYGSNGFGVDTVKRQAYEVIKRAVKEKTKAIKEEMRTKSGT